MRDTEGLLRGSTPQPPSASLNKSGTLKEQLPRPKPLNPKLHTPRGSKGPLQKKSLGVPGDPRIQRGAHGAGNWKEQAINMGSCMDVAIEG